LNWIFEKILKNCCSYKKKKPNEFYFYIQKFNEKAIKAKKIKSSLYIFKFSFYFYLLNFVLKKTSKITQCKIFAPIFFGVKKHFTLHQFFFQNTAQCFLKHRFLFYTVYCAGVIFGNFGCSSDCNCNAMPAQKHIFQNLYIDWSNRKTIYLILI
jgi:hypothetical protein